MVARSPPKLKKMVAPINPLLLRETLTKVDRCMSRLQELQYTVTGGSKVISGVNLSPRSTRGYLRTSLRCKQETLRIKNGTPKKSPVGKFPSNPGTGCEWRRMSLPAMLLGETIGEIIEASQFAKEIVAAVNSDPKTPVTQRRKHRAFPENSELRTRRNREKQKAGESQSSPMQLQRVRSRINFKLSSPPDKQQIKDSRSSYLLANRVSPKLKPWAKKAVLFPNPLFLSTPSAKTRSPAIARKRETPHKFLIKSPVKVRSPRKVCVSPTITKRGVSPVKVVASKLRRSFSPSRLASRFVSPMKSRKSHVEEKKSVKQRPVLVSMRYSTGGVGGKFGQCP